MVQPHVDSHYAAKGGETGRSPRALDGSQDVETCVIGGGLAGLTCALELARAGREVLLLEANSIGWGASGRNGGFVSDGYAAGIEDIVATVGMETGRKLFSLGVQGVDYVRDSIAQSGQRDIVQGHGHLKLIRHNDVGSLQSYQTYLKSEFGVDRRFIEKAELGAFVQSRQYRAALLNENAFHIDPLAYSRLLASKVEKEGGSIFEGCRAESLHHRSGKWAVACGRHTVTAKHVVLATSAYGGPFTALERAIVPVSTYVVSTPPMANQLNSAIAFGGAFSDTRRAGDYFRTVDEGQGRRLIWGGRITTRRSVPGDLSAILRRDIEQVFPQLAPLDVERAWAGWMGYCRHKMPIIGKFWPQQGENLWSCTAFGGHGLNTTAVGGKCVADGISGRNDDWQAFAGFAPRWNGGVVGQLAVQANYWQMQWQDRRDENRGNK